MCFVVAMAVLLGGVAMKKDLPPYPEKIVDANDSLLYEHSDIISGLNVNQRFGGPAAGKFLITTYTHLNAVEIKDDGNERDRLGIELYGFST